MRKILLLILGLAVTITSFSQEGKLDKAKKSLSEDTTNSTGSTRIISQGGSRNQLNDRRHRPFANLLFDLTLGLVYYTAIESPFEKEG